MKTTIEKLEQSQVRVIVEIEEQIAANEYSKACRKISETVNIHGFRKGKAPKNVVEKFVGVDRIQREALNSILPKIFADVVSENQFNIITEPQIESFEFVAGKPLTVNAILELRPEVNLGDYKNISLDVEEVKVADDAVDGELKKLQSRIASFNTITDRATNDTDVAVIDFEGSVDGELIKGGAGKNYPLDLGNSNFIPGFAEQIVGKNTGDEFVIKVTFPAEYHDKSLQSKEAEFKIKLNEIREKVLPELNDEFAKKVSGMETLEELRKDIKNYLEKNAEQENIKRKQMAIVDKVTDNSKIEIPDAMINREAKQLMNETQQRIKAQGGNFEQMLDEKGQEDLWNELRGEAAARIKTSLVLTEIAEKEGISVSQEQFEQKIKELAAMYQADEKEVYTQLAKNINMANTLTQQLLAQNITDFLLANNTFNFVQK